MIHNMVVDQLNTILFVVFGIPGAGKTTIAKHVVQNLSTTTTSVGNNEEATIPNYFVLDLDLDDCVPEWMRFNFAQGIYPTLQQRNQFALSCCDYVKESIHKFTESSVTNCSSPSAIKPILVIVSFSFVNDDLRINFRNEFPNSHWILIHTNELEAQRRIEQRSDHFYKGKQPNNEADCTESIQHPSTSSNDNSEWKFAPVTFPHTIVNGHNPIEETSSEITELIHATVRTSTTTNKD